MRAAALLTGARAAEMRAVIEGAPRRSSWLGQTGRRPRVSSREGREQVRSRAGAWGTWRQRWRRVSTSTERPGRLGRGDAERNAGLQVPVQPLRDTALLHGEALRGPLIRSAVCSFPHLSLIVVGGVGIFESPTGTVLIFRGAREHCSLLQGKSLSLICGSLTWLREQGVQGPVSNSKRALSGSDAIRADHGQARTQSPRRRSMPQSALRNRGCRRGSTSSLANCRRCAAIRYGAAC